MFSISHSGPEIRLFWYNVVPFGRAFAVSYGIFFSANLWYLIFVDNVLVVRFRPLFVQAPDTPYYTTMKPHAEGWLRGLIFGLVVSMVAETITRFLLPSRQ